MGLFEFKIRQFSKIMKWAEMQDVSQLRQFLFDDKCSNRLFVASGGSFSAAAYAELLATDQGFMSHALTPLLYMGSGFSRIATKVLLISASGCNNDIVRAYNNEYRTTKQKVGAVVLTPKGKLQSLLHIYTRPSDYKGWKVPEILLSGNEAKIRQWEFDQAMERTKRLRPDLLEE